jgi:hypothetical protein
MVLVAAEVVARVKERDGGGFSCHAELGRGGKWKGARLGTLPHGEKAVGGPGGDSEAPVVGSWQERRRWATVG